MTTLGLDYHGHPFPAAAKRRAGYSVTPLHYAFEMGGGGSKTLSRQREKAAVAGLQIFPVYKKISAGLFFSAEKGIWIARIRHREDLLGLGEIFCFE